MKNKILKMISFSFASAIFCASFAFAEMEQVSFSSYYPAPFGMYQQLRVSGKLGIKTIDDPQADLDVNGSMIVTGGSGDVNGNGSADLFDVVTIYDYVFNGIPVLSRAQLAEADVDGDGLVTFEDVAILYEEVNIGSRSDAFRKRINNVDRQVYFRNGPPSVNYLSVNDAVGIGVPAAGSVGGDTTPSATLDVRGGFIQDGGTGDFFGNGVIDEACGEMALLHAAGLADPPLTRKQLADLDVDGSGQVTFEDGNIMLNMAADLATKQEAARIISNVGSVDVRSNSSTHPQFAFVVEGKFVNTRRNYTYPEAGMGVDLEAPELGVGGVPLFPFQVGGPFKNISAPSANVAAAIKRDLWVDGDIYGNSVGGWTHDKSVGVLYPTLLTDKLVRGVDYSSALLHVASGSAEKEEAKDAVLVQIGNGIKEGNEKISANAAVYGTLGVSDNLAVAGKIKAYRDLRLMRTDRKDECTSELAGTMRFFWPSASQDAALLFCAPETVEPSEGGGVIGDGNWTIVQSWQIPFASSSVIPDGPDIE